MAYLGLASVNGRQDVRVTGASDSGAPPASMLARIGRGDLIPSEQLLPYLSQGDQAQRFRVNAQLADAYAQAGTEPGVRRAWEHIQRAWMLCGCSAELLPRYLELALAVNDVRAMREAYKRLGMQAASQGDLDAAIEYFNEWQHAYPTYAHLDKYEYDCDILAALERMAEPYRLPSGAPEPLPGRKIRVAYLVKGLAETGSVLVKINFSFAQWHDRSRFDITWFAPETEAEVIGSEDGRNYLRHFARYQSRVIMAPAARSAEQRLVALGGLIRSAKPDVLVTSGALADFRHFFVTALQPAPRSIGFIQGPPAQFAAPRLDWGIAWTKHPLVDCPIGCSQVNLETALPERDAIAAGSRGALDVPADACLLVSAGRAVKFQEPDFWRAILDFLEGHPRAYYLALGVEESQIQFLPALLTRELASRVRFMAWRSESEYLGNLCLGDIFIDTYPSGGGVVLLDAMSLAIPVVSFENDYGRLFDQASWSLAQEVLGSTDTIALRGDFNRWKQILSRLVDDPTYRREAAGRGRNHVRCHYSNPERMVRRCEDVYLKVVLGRASA
jgi:hypothetical protein